MTDLPAWLSEALKREKPPAQHKSTRANLERALTQARVPVSDLELVTDEHAVRVGIAGGRMASPADHEGFVLAALFEVLKQEKRAVAKREADKVRAARIVAANPNIRQKDT